MPTRYSGPLRDEPIAIELQNTAYASAGAPVDGLADPAQAHAWLTAIAGRAPLEGAVPAAALDGLVALRGAIRDALLATIDGAAPAPEALAAINAASAGDAPSPRVELASAGRLARVVDHGPATPADVAVAAFARDAIDLLTGARRDDLRACGAPGCVLLFLKDHPRREWCCNACGNRARQARHYRRVREV